MSINVHLSAAWIRHEASDSMLFANRQLQSRQQAKHAFVGWLVASIQRQHYRACSVLRMRISVCHASARRQLCVRSRCAPQTTSAHTVTSQSCAASPQLLPWIVKALLYLTTNDAAALLWLIPVANVSLISRHVISVTSHTRLRYYTTVFSSHFRKSNTNTCNPKKITSHNTNIDTCT